MRKLQKEKIMEPFTFTYIKRGAPLNDYLWYLTLDRNKYTITIACRSAQSVEEARKEATKIVDALYETFATIFNVNKGRKRSG